MKFSARTRMIADYMAATENEIAIDNCFLALSGIQPGAAGYLPRSPKWVKIGLRHPRLLRCAWRLLWTAWIGGGALLYLLYQLLPYWRKAGRHRQCQAWPGAAGGAIYALSSRTGDIFTAAQFPDFPLTWYTVPWVELTQIPAAALRVDLLTLLGRADVVQAAKDALLATWLLARRRRSRKWLLQSYTAFRWFLVRMAVDKHPRQLVIAEHFDRWAVLADSAVRRCRQQGLTGNGAGELVQVQHGSLAKLGDTPDEAATLRLYRKLGSVTRLYAYGAQAEQVFRETVFSPRCARRAIDVRTFTPSIELTGPRRGAGIRLLFVGYPLCEEFHRNVFETLRQRQTFRAFYKPHPRAGMSEAMRHVGWEVIELPNHFPAVELLVSYESTLVVEYQGVGIGAVVHPLNIDSNDTAATVARIEAVLCGLSSARGAA